MKGITPYVLVGVGGFFGSIARYLTARAAADVLGTTFPVGTLIVNVVGSFLLGLAAVVLAMRYVPYGDEIRLALSIGFLGAYTTFSTFAYETNRLVDDGSWSLAAVNVAASVAAALLSLRLGVVLAHWIFD